MFTFTDADARALLAYDDRPRWVPVDTHRLACEVADMWAGAAYVAAYRWVRAALEAVVAAEDAADRRAEAHLAAATPVSDIRC